MQFQEAYFNYVKASGGNKAKQGATSDADLIDLTFFHPDGTQFIETCSHQQLQDFLRSGFAYPKQSGFANPMEGYEKDSELSSTNEKGSGKKKSAKVKTKEPKVKASVETPSTDTGIKRAHDLVATPEKKAEGEHFTFF